MRRAIRGRSNGPAATCDQDLATKITRRDLTAFTGDAFMETKAMQPDDADSMPLRTASPHGIGTLVIRFIGLLFLSVTALALVWIR
jgi:hypothetical protein